MASFGAEQPRAGTRNPTCEVCRERKVRCDRNKPACDRCTKGGYQCRYPTATGRHHVDDVTIQSLHARLLHAESRLLEQSRRQASSGTGPTPNNTQSDDARVGFEGTTDNSPPPTGHASWAATSMDNHFEGLDLPDFGMTDDAVDCPSLDNFPGIFGEPAGEDASYLRPRMSMDDQCPSVPSLTSVRSIYYDKVHRSLPLLSRHTFLRMESGQVDSCRFAGLRHAVVMASINTAAQQRRLVVQHYAAARRAIAEAEKSADSADYVNIEMVQTLILLLRQEVRHNDLSRILLTLSHLVCLVGQLACAQSEDRPNADARHHLSPTFTAHASYADLDRAIYWTAALHSVINTRVGPRPMPDFDGILQMWGNARGRSSLLSAGHSDSEVTDATAREVGNHMSLFVKSNHLIVLTHSHFLNATMDADSVKGNLCTGCKDAETFNFCASHEEIESRLTRCLAQVESEEYGFADPNSPILGVAHVILLGARLALYSAAVMAVGRVKFLGTVAAEQSQAICIEAATEIADVLRRHGFVGGSSGDVSALRECAIFVESTVALAARTLRSFHAQPSRRERHAPSESLCCALETICTGLDSRRTAGAAEELAQWHQSTHNDAGMSAMSDSRVNYLAWQQ